MFFWLVDLTRINGIIDLVDHKNEGVLTAVMSLLIELAKKDGKKYDIAVPKVIETLERVSFFFFAIYTSKGVKKITCFKISLNGKCARNYIYYRTPCPWLQVKCLRFLQYLYL